MDELLAELARRLVDEPEAVRVEQVEDDDGSLVLRLHVAEGDVGKVIGRQGRIARALRTIVRAGGPNAGRRLQLEIVVVRIATLYDIHGNLAALEAVLADVPDEATIVVGGDVVAGGPQPAETLERAARARGPGPLDPRQRRPRARRRARSASRRRARSTTRSRS